MMSASSPDSAVVPTALAHGGRSFDLEVPKRRAGSQGAKSELIGPQKAMSNAAKRDAPPGCDVANHAVGRPAKLSVGALTGRRMLIIPADTPRRWTIGAWRVC